MLKLAHKILNEARENKPYFLRTDLPETIVLKNKKFKLKKVTTQSNNIVKYSFHKNTLSVNVFYLYGVLVKVSVKRYGKKSRIFNVENENGVFLDMLDERDDKVEKILKTNTQGGL